MTAIAEFLLARIAEDEAANKPGPEPESWCDRGEGLHLGHARVLAECQAKRLIVAEFVQALDDFWRVEAAALEVVLRLHAAVYADHPDYDEAWRP